MDNSDHSAFFATALANRRRLTAPEILQLRKTQRVLDAYHRLFMTEDNELREDAVVVLKDLIGISKIGIIGGEPSDAQLRDQYGRKTMIIHLINRLDIGGDRIQAIATQLKGDF